MMCSYLLLTLCMASPVNDAVPPTSSSSWRANAQTAKEAAARQDWPGAAAALKETQSSDSEINAILSYDLGVAAYRAGDYALAEKAFERASRTGSSSLAAAAAYNQGNAIIQQTPIAPSEQQSPAIDSNQLKQQYQAAIDAYRRALQAEPTLDDARANVEWTWSKLKQLEETEQQQQNEDDQESQQEDSQKGSDSQQGQQQQNGSQQNSAQQEDSQEGSDSQQGQQQQQQQDGSQQNSAPQQADSQQGQEQQDGSQQDTPQQQGEPQQEPSQQNPQQNPSQQGDKGQQQPSSTEQSNSSQKNPEQSTPQQTQQDDSQGSGTGTSPQENANQDPNPDVSSSGTPQGQGRMTPEEAERILQVIRDRERQRRDQKRQEQTVGTAPTGKDW